MIDVHTHMTDYATAKVPFSAELLVKQMGELDGVDRFVVLPLIGPEFGFLPCDTDDVLEAYEKYPDKIIPFCCVDPRVMPNTPQTDFSWWLSQCKERGCRGLGEFTPNIYFDDPRCLNLFRQCGDIGFPIVYHLHRDFTGYGVVDDANFTRLENALRECPKTVLFGHAGFWANVPRAEELMKKYPNAYGDLSAGSGWGGMHSHGERVYEYLEEFQDKLCFGTDMMRVGQQVPQVEFFNKGLREGNISKKVFDKITKDNLSELLGL